MVSIIAQLSRGPQYTVAGLQPSDGLSCDLSRLQVFMHQDTFAIVIARESIDGSTSAYNALDGIPTLVPRGDGVSAARRGEAHTRARSSPRVQFERVYLVRMSSL